jgi:molybdopterin-guanine dinucleotide biosynthesis protein A
LARRDLTGALLVGGASTRFGSAKALAELDGETLAERGWRVLGELCEERLAVGKQADGLELPFPVLDDGSEVRASLAGIVAALRSASYELSVVLPVDCPLDAALPQTGPLPGAYRRSALPTLEQALATGVLSIRDALTELRVETVECEPGLLVNVNTPEELRRLL